jgi:hypothetical protein
VNMSFNINNANNRRTLVGKQWNASVIIAG